MPVNCGLIHGPDNSSINCRTVLTGTIIGKTIWGTAYDAVTEMGPVPFTMVAVIGPCLCQAVFAVIQPKDPETDDRSSPFIPFHLLSFCPFQFPGIPGGICI
jgi:hypothetical protein